MLASLRLHHGLSQMQLADKVGIPSQQIQKYEQGSNQFSPTRLLQLGNIFGVPANFLLGEKQPKNPSAQLPKIMAADLDKGAVRMFEAFQQIKSQKLRKQLSVLTQLIARSGKRS